MGKTIKKQHVKPKNKPKSPQITKWKAKNKFYVGYCHERRHPGYVTFCCMAHHKCLEKHCPFLERIDSHKFWSDPNYKNSEVGYKKTERLKKYVDYSKKNSERGAS